MARGKSLRAGEVEVIERTRSIQRRDDDPIVLIETRLVNAARMSTATYITTCFSIPGVEVVRINRKSLRGVQKVWNIDRQWWAENYGAEASGEAQDDEKVSELVEAWIERDFGPGDYDLCLVYKGMLHKHHWIVLGEVAARDQAAQGDVDAEIAQHVKRLSNMTTIREWKRLLDETEGKGGEEMKAEELIAVANALRPAVAPTDGMAPVLMEMLRLERERNDRLTIAASAPRPSALSEALEPVITLLKEKILTPKGLEGLLFRRHESPAMSVPTPSWIERLGEALAPTLERLVPVAIQSVMAASGAAPGRPALRVLPGGASAPGEVPAGPASLPPPTATEAPSMADNPQFTEILDAFVEELRKPEAERDLPALVASLQALPLSADRTLFDHVAWVAQALPAIQAVALRAIDPRLLDTETRPGTMALLAYIRGLVRAEAVPPDGAA